MELETRKVLLKNAVRFFYDLQKLRCQSGNRSSKKAKEAEAYLESEDKEFLTSVSTNLNSLEKSALKEVKHLLNGIPIWDKFLHDTKGIGPTMGGVLVSEINIENCNTASQLWAWCGLAVRDGHADRRVKGQKTHYNPWLKAKVLVVLGDSFIKSAKLGEDGRYYVSMQKRDENGKGITYIDEEGKKRKQMIDVPYQGVPYRKFYDDYKHRKENQQVDVCMCCGGKGTYIPRPKGKPGEPRPKEDPDAKTQVCKNCNGTGGPAPWGASPEHRHMAAMRYMVKQFLLDMWKEWRTLEGLEVRPPYAEEYLGRTHHAA